MKIQPAEQADGVTRNEPSGRELMSNLVYANTEASGSHEAVVL
jgi:hypothetical protein